MSGVVAVVAALVIALGLVLLSQRRLARRLVLAGQRLAEDVVPTGTGLAEATSVVERVIDRTLLRRGEVSIVEARLARALAAIPQGVVVFDTEGNIAHRNKVAARYLSARHSEALVEEAISELAAAAARGEQQSATTRTIDLFGPPRRTLVLRSVALERQDDDLGTLVTIDDVTDRRRLEAVRRDFVANISHELKTPVGALALLAETIVAEDDPAVVRRLAGRMLDEAARVGRTIDDLLELSRIEADDDTAREAVPVARFVGEAVDRVRGAAEQQQIHFAVDDIPPGLVVAGDRRQLVSATYNLLDNAVKYSDPGSSVHVRIEADRGRVDISVEDHGVGIPRRDLERVFERFYRVDPARGRDTGGTGLGLAIVRHIVSNHAGEVRVESREGEGSTFTLRLPADLTGPPSGGAEAG